MRSSHVLLSMLVMRAACKEKADMSGGRTLESRRRRIQTVESRPSNPDAVESSPSNPDSVKSSLYLSGGRTLVRKAGREVPATKHRFADDEANCVSQFLVEGNWCEETCVKASNPMAMRLKSSAGTCSSQGFEFLKTDFEPMMFTASNSDLPEQASVDLILQASNCNPHYKINGEVCETFCVPSEDLVRFSKQCTGVMAGTCPSQSFPKFVGKKKMSVYVKYDPKTGTP